MMNVWRSQVLLELLGETLSHIWTGVKDIHHHHHQIGPRAAMILKGEETEAAEESNTSW